MRIPSLVKQKVLGVRLRSCRLGLKRSVEYKASSIRKNHRYPKATYSAPRLTKAAAALPHSTVLRTQEVPQAYD